MGCEVLLLGEEHGRACGLWEASSGVLMPGTTPAGGDGRDDGYMAALNRAQSHTGGAGPTEAELTTLAMGWEWWRSEFPWQLLLCMISFQLAGVPKAAADKRVV